MGGDQSQGEQKPYCNGILQAAGPDGGTDDGFLTETPQLAQREESYRRGGGAPQLLACPVPTSFKKGVPKPGLALLS